MSTECRLRSRVCVSPLERVASGQLNKCTRSGIGSIRLQWVRKFIETVLIACESGKQKITLPKNRFATPHTLHCGEQCVDVRCELIMTPRGKVGDGPNSLPRNLRYLNYYKF